MTTTEGGETRMATRVPEALRRFIWDIQSMVELADGPREILFIGRDLMRRLVSEEGWLPEAFRTAGDEPRLYELYRDGMERFCIAASVFGPGQEWPSFRDGVWEISGVLEGEVLRRERAEGAAPIERRLSSGAVETAQGTATVSMANASLEAGAVVIHVHGGDIGRMTRQRVGADGTAQDMVSGYDNPPEAPAYDILSIQAEVVD
ncbi:cysteine dioxygenase family protein [Xanthobacter sediminis]|uniref:cysteine dioxygenase family protein n=1 Tax=Xanthobacter sediminis TaxID=3119926 RepID=UPI00372BE577